MAGFGLEAEMVVLVKLQNSNCPYTQRVESWEKLLAIVVKSTLPVGFALKTREKRQVHMTRLVHCAECQGVTQKDFAAC